MKLRFVLLFSLILLGSFLCYGQNRIDLNAKVNVDIKTIQIEQRIVYNNQSNDTLNAIYLNDWNNSYSTKKTPLAQRFTEEFNDKFHFAKSEQRGYTVVTRLVDENGVSLNFTNLEVHPDVIEVTLAKPLLPGESYDIALNYDVVLPDDNFTGYGISPDKNLNLKYWYITPAVYDGAWQYYSNKNLDDLYIPNADLNFQIEFPLNYSFSYYNT